MPVKILTFSSLYPNSAQPRHGIFVEQRLRQLVSSGKVSATVVAPVPWVPPGLSRLTRYSAMSRVPWAARRHGIDIVHPRYPVIPKVGMNVAASLMARATLGAVRQRLEQDDEIALIDAHYFYPDGVAATRIGAAVGRPVVVTARGSDINLIADFANPREQILRAAQACARVVAVSEALRQKLLALGVAPDRVSTMRNGVDLEAFRPEEGGPDRWPAKRGFLHLLSIGNLTEFKGHDLVVRALAERANLRLTLVGDGPMRGELEALVAHLGLGERVHFLGELGHEAMAEVYRSGDVTVLMSAREGLPNVLLESMACGTPVVATPVGGIPEVVDSPGVGDLVDERSVDGLLASIDRLSAAFRGRDHVRQHALRFGWDAVSEGLIELFDDIVARQSSHA